MAKKKCLTLEGLSVAISRIQNLLNGKVNKVSDMGLSSNDYTTAEKNKLSSIAEGANVSTIDAPQFGDMAI